MTVGYVSKAFQSNCTLLEVARLRAALSDKFTLKQYKPTWEVILKYKDGGVSIIDQWICAHARYL